jgi:hypothetical protein
LEDRWRVARPLASTVSFSLLASSFERGVIVESESFVKLALFSAKTLPGPRSIGIRAA